MSKDLDAVVVEKAQAWLDGHYDEATKKQVKYLMDNDKKELTESFYKDLEFGTGGLRGIMGVGTNRMNIYTVGMATQGLANYLKKNFKGETIRVAIGHDSRNNSRLFAEHTADIFASNGFIVYLFDALRPTPELSFAIRELGCQSGVVVTASHNPKEYNGYKAYWSDGSQVTPPHDKNIIAEVEKIKSVDQILTGKNKENIHILDEKFDQLYLEKIHQTLDLAPDAIAKYHDMKIVYTPIHGSGAILVPASLKRFGFTNVVTVKEQNIIDGNFPTVESPNPEERTTMKMAIDLAKKENAELVLATDPDSDRIGIAVPDGKGDYVLLNGNQTCVLLTYFLCRRWNDLGRLDGHQYIIKTIVTSEMMAKVAASFGIKYYDCLTGFKYIAKIIRENEGTGWQYIGGGEESFGFMVGDFVRDKDSITTTILACEIAAVAKANGSSFFQELLKIYQKTGMYRESLVNIVREGVSGAQQIKAMMDTLRENPLKTIDGSPVVRIDDYKTSVSKDLTTGTQTPIQIPKSDVLIYYTADGAKIAARPSGTEPKIKFYFSVNAPLPSLEQYEQVWKALGEKLQRIEKEMDF